ncbi:MAG: hypothetical protein RL375_3134 [Pseudomonadota bacterium]
MPPPHPSAPRPQADHPPSARARLTRVAASAALAVLAAGCVFAPRTIAVYDPECQITSRQMVLQAEQMPIIGHCRGEECGAMLVVFGAVSAATAVVSGSIVVVGNVVYWFEKQNQCRRVEAAK